MYVLLFCAISGTYSLPTRLLNLKQKSIREFMTKWICEDDENKRKELLQCLWNGTHRPNESGKGKEEQSLNFENWINLCVHIMKHAPVIKEINGLFIIEPLKHLPSSSQIWSEIIGFDPVDCFGGISVEGWGIIFIKNLGTHCALANNLKCFRVPKIPTTQLKHCHMVQSLILKESHCHSSQLQYLQWLFYHGVPHPKYTKRDKLVNQVNLTCSADQPLDYSRIYSVIFQQWEDESYVQDHLGWESWNMFWISLEQCSSCRERLLYFQYFWHWKKWHSQESIQKNSEWTFRHQNNETSNSNGQRSWWQSSFNWNKSHSKHEKWHLWSFFGIC